MTAIIGNLLALFMVLVGLAVILGGPRLGGQVIGGGTKVTLQSVQWVLRLVMSMLRSLLGMGIRGLIRPRPREPRY